MAVPRISRRDAILALSAAGTGGLSAAVKRVKLSAKTLEGEQLEVGTIKGKAVLVQFWATWCTFCQSDEGAIESIVKKFGPKGLVVIAVDAYEPRQKVLEYLAKHPRASKIALLEETNLAPLLTARNYPEYVLFDRGGNVVATQNGASGEAALRRLIQRVGL